jgi:3-oxoacyl-[acyl-carrier-protein] synthase II
VRDRLPASQVLVTVGSPCTMSAVGSTETATAHMLGSADLTVLSAFDAGLVDLAVGADGSLEATWRDGTAADADQIEQLHGDDLRSSRGIRIVPELADRGAPVDVAAALPHDLRDGGLRRLTGLGYADIRGSELRDMHGLFDDDPRLGPSLQAQLFAYAGLGALASLPRPLPAIIDQPADFRVVAASAFSGIDSWGELRTPGDDGPRDKFAARLASSLSTHGPALVSSMLAPSFPLGRTAKNPESLRSLRTPAGFMRVPQAPMSIGGACAASLIALADLAPQMLLDLPGFRRPRMALWMSADSPTAPHWQVLDGFGPGALVTSDKVSALNEGRDPADRRSIADSLAPFDVDACGTVVGDGGSGLVVTTLDIALRHGLDITSIIVGWGQSGETGGKAHFAGVGFGGENALVGALEIARRSHGLGVADFEYVVAHATGTRTNSKTDLTSVAAARAIAADLGGGTVPVITVGTPKSLGDGHTMGDAGLKAVDQAIRYVCGEPAVGLPTLRNLDPELGEVVDGYDLRRGPIDGDADGGAILSTQGFGGYDGALALRAANPESIARYDCDQRDLAAYLERWPEIRRRRIADERLARVTRGSTLQLALRHRWHP